ncbi:uncharacterized protein [Dysidea avara]|uniref:uncharacterized protein n=1 Tax=Dysidea avara TaxID=196820 RepID=UPI00332079CF
MLIKLNALLWINIQLINVHVLFNNGTVPFGVVMPTGGFAILSNAQHDAICKIKILSSTFNGNNGSCVFFSVSGKQLDILINDSNFTNTGLQPGSPVVYVTSLVNTMTQVNFSNVWITNNKNMNAVGSKAVISIVHYHGDIKISFVQVGLKSNVLSTGYSFNDDDNNEGVIHVISKSDGKFDLQLKNCKFIDNIYYGTGAILHVIKKSSLRDMVQITGSQFDNNVASNGIVYVAGDLYQPGFIELILRNSVFTNNIGSALYLSNCHFEAYGAIVFVNNTADNGAAMYLSKGCDVFFLDAIVNFINNSALQYGGAMYVDHTESCDHISLGQEAGYPINFMNNIAGIAGNSLYYNIPKYCKVDTDINSETSIMFIPCEWSYSQLVDDKLIRITCDYDYTLLNSTGFPIVTSPHELRLYFVNDDGANLTSDYDHNAYFIKNNILGHKVAFKGAVFDYFNKPAEPTLFSVECIDCSTFILDISHLFIDNVTLFTVSFTGSDTEGDNMNVSVEIISVSTSYLSIKTILTIEIQPCTSHPGFIYSDVEYTCMCYNHEVLHCYDDYNEIKRGYWFGIVLQRNLLHHCVLIIIVTLLIVGRPDRDTLSYPMKSMISVNITEQESLVENAVQDSP